MILEFQDLHPGITIDLMLDDRTVDLIYENFDLTLRYGKIEDQEVVARRIGWVQRILVAAPSYLQLVGDITSPGQLSELDVISTFTGLSSRNSMVLVTADDGTAEIPVRPVFKSNNSHVILNSLLRGRGVGAVQRNLVTGLLANGELVRVLPTYAVRSTEAFLAFPSTKFMRPVVRAFTEFVIPRLRAIEGISQDSRDISSLL